MKIQPPGRRATQAIGVVVVVAGAIMLATSLAFVSGLILERRRGSGGFLPVLAMGLLGVILLILGRLLRTWANRDRD